ncbi:ABC transporter ATP-binding protein [Desulfosarcina alkanivorans]|uniref:ABC transporter ATP-binding protein n=1 Tax=Desulfosarcina alkanivorans TaxID=571177 RepID=A0A5K7YJX7_9BACT|nr:ABC transporter ATP-binding protein [Desulfosarcina alkanivorans]BBO67101.1 ABC transporter ATP-binding protein [Desulfosarcina alkanivorans]
MVRCSNIRKSYVQGKVTVSALKAVNLTVEAGEFLALAGPSGSGKTTLLNLIGGLDLPDAGTIRVDGTALNRLTPAGLARLRLTRIGFIFQAFNLIPVLTAAENVAYVMHLQGVDAGTRRRRALAILDEVGLGDMGDRRPAELSGGQQQRVAVARAIVSGPAIVLADEPTANLDSATGEALLTLMERMNREKGATFIFSTHDQMVMDHAHRLVHIRDGRIEDDTRRQT